MPPRLLRSELTVWSAIVSGAAEPLSVYPSMPRRRKSRPAVGVRVHAPALKSWPYFRLASTSSPVVLLVAVPSKASRCESYQWTAPPTLPSTQSPPLSFHVA